MIRRIAATVAVLLILAGCSPGTAPAEPPDLPDPPVTPPKQEEPVAYDIVVRGGLLVDGSGEAPRKADVGIIDSKIAFLGELGSYTAKREIKATDLVVAPGFINPHSHTHDFINPFEDLDATASLLQGITTEFGGMDGRSPLPIAAELTRIEEAGTGVNFGLFVGQGSVRGSVMGNTDQNPANSAQLEEMQQMVRQAMEEGAWGVSTGLEYVPGKFAGTDEIAALVKAAQPYGGIYATHMRSEGWAIEDAVREALAIGKQAGVPVNLSHFKIVHYPNWGKEDQVVALVEQAIRGGQAVFADVYPYMAPDYAVNRPLAEWAEALPPADIVITRAVDPDLEGKTLAQAAELMHLTPEAAVRQLAAADPNMSVVALVTSEKAMRRFYQSPWSVVSTDGESQPILTPAEALQYAFHRRGYGTYPQLLGQYVRDQKLMPLESMVRKMTGLVADNLHLKDRGYLRIGYQADLVLFNPVTVADQTTWLDPQQPPVGIQYVLVNGQIAVVEGKRVPVRAGMVLRHAVP